MVIGAVLLVIYMLPSAIMYYQKGYKNEKVYTTTFGINVLLGWSVVGWLYCLYVALTAPSVKELNQIDEE